VECLCEDKLPSTVCVARHTAEIEKVHEQLHQEIHSTRHDLDGGVGEDVALVDTEYTATSKGIWPGACDPLFSCTLMVNGRGITVSLGRNGKDNEVGSAGPVLWAIKDAFTGDTAPCLSGECGFALGWPAGSCDLKLQFSFGAGINSCDTVKDMMATFHLYFKTDMCIGGTFGDAAEKMGWSLCYNVANIAYYPFVGKFFAMLSLPVFIYGVQAKFRYQTPVHDLSRATLNYIESFSSSTNKWAWNYQTRYACSNAGDDQLIRAYCSGSEQHYYRQYFLTARGWGDVSLDVQAGIDPFGFGTVILHRIVSPPKEFELWAAAASGHRPGVMITVQYNRNKCIDYNYRSGSVYMDNCHSGPNQKWCFDGERMKTQYDDKCLDYNYNTGGVYMHGCHGGTNQNWYWDNWRIKTRYNNNKCLDYNFNTNALYLNDCHNGRNQIFDWKETGKWKCSE
jgi:hypothetical protein